MRYSRLQRRKAKHRYAAFLVVAVLLMGGIYVLSAGTAGRFLGSLIGSLLSPGDPAGGTAPTQTPAVTDTPTLTLPNPTEDAEKITETIQALPLYMRAIQMGAFNDGENARAFGLEIQARGGAGYVVHDAFYRVLAMGFASEEDAHTVQQQLKEDEIESSIYKISAPGANLQITATRANVAAIKGAYGAWEETFRALETIIMDLDSGRITSSEAHKQAAERGAQVEEVRQELAALSKNQESNVILSGLADLYQKGSEAFSAVISENPLNRVAISSKIKYTYIDMILQYKQYMEGIT